MNKNELIEVVAANAELGNPSKAQAERMVKSILDGFAAGLRDSADHKIQIVGFGTFSVRERKARTGRNPQTGATMKIPASRTVGFTAGQALKAAVAPPKGSAKAPAKAKGKKK